MKLAILSDFHLGYDRFFEDAYAQALEALESAASLADAILIPGDIFDNRAPRPEVLAQGINIFRNLAGKQWNARVLEYNGKKKVYSNVPILAIPGTHERRSQEAENAVQLLSLAGLLVDISEATVILGKGEDKVAVYGLGGVSDERVKEVLEKLDPTPVKGTFSIFMFHQSIYELLPFSKDFLAFGSLPKGFDLYVDGHIHNMVEKSVDGKPFLIPGSTVLTQLKEAEQEPKGFFIFDTATGKHSFHKINSRKFVFLRLDITGMSASSIREKISASVEKVVSGSAAKPIIRIALEGKAENGQTNTLDIQELAKRFEGTAILDISKSGLDEKEIRAIGEDVRKGVLENISIRDYGMSIFLEKLKKGKYSLKASPSVLFDALSSETTKDKAVKNALELLFSK